MPIKADTHREWQKVDVVITNDKFKVWKGRDFWHKDIEVDIKLLTLGEVQLYTRKHEGVLKQRKVTLEQLHAALEALIEEPQ